MPTLTTFALAAALATSSATPLPKLAVLRLKALDPSVAPDTELLVEVILADLSASHRVDAIGASDIEAMLGVERQRQLLGCSEGSSSCLAELGGALGAEYVLVGTLAKLERSKRLDVKLLDTKTNRVVFRGFATASSAEDLVQRTRETIARLVQELPRPAEPSTAAASTTAAAPSAPVATAPATAGNARGAPASSPPPPSNREVSAGAGAGFPWPALLALGGVALGAGGGGLSVWTVTDYDAQRSHLSFSAAQGYQLRNNIGLGVAGLGAAAALVGTWLWIFPPNRGPSVAVVPTRGGAAFSLGGTF